MMTMHNGQDREAGGLCSRRLLGAWLTVAVLIAMFAAPRLAVAGECPRIVSQSPYITHMLEYLGLTSCIVGASRYDDLDVPETGGILDPDAEAIARPEPELAFTSSWVEPAGWEDRVPAEGRPLCSGVRGLAGVQGNIERIAQAAGLNDGSERAAPFVRSGAMRPMPRALLANMRS